MHLYKCLHSSRHNKEVEHSMEWPCYPTYFVSIKSPYQKLCTVTPIQGNPVLSSTGSTSPFLPSLSSPRWVISLSTLSISLGLACPDKRGVGGAWAGHSLSRPPPEGALAAQFQGGTKLH